VPRARLFVALLVGASVLFMSTAPAFAHTTKTVGNYQFTVGWQHEPTYVGVQNGVALFVHDASGNPVDDLGATGLKVQVVFSGQTSDPLIMQASFDPDTKLGTHGEFDAAIIPTRPGDYTFHFTGDINGQKIDESFTSGPQTFDTAKAPSPIEFPAKDPTIAELADGFNRLGPRVDAARVTTAQALAKAKSAQSSATAATTLAIVALVAGLAVGGAGLRSAIRARRKSDAIDPTAS
jgi:hypothetical protein